MEVVNQECPPTTKIKVIDENTEVKYLGVYCSPNGTSKKQSRDLILKSRQIENCIKNKCISREEANTIYFNIWIPRIKYSLIATHLTEGKCNEVQKPILQVILPKMGIPENSKIEWIHRHRNAGGLGLYDIWDIQGSLKVQYIVEQIRKNRELGVLMKRNIELVHRESGIHFLPCSDREPPSYLHDTWIKKVWRYTWETGISIIYTGINEQNVSKNNDKHIMDLFITCYSRK